MLLEDFCKKIDAVPLSVIDDIRQEIEERKRSSGGEPNRELAFNICLQIIDKHIGERSEDAKDNN